MPCMNNWCVLCVLHWVVSGRNAPLSIMDVVHMPLSRGSCAGEICGDDSPSQDYAVV